MISSTNHDGLTRLGLRQHRDLSYYRPIDYPRFRCITCDSGMMVLCSGHAPSWVCCQVDKTTGFSEYCFCRTSLLLHLRPEGKFAVRWVAMTTVSIVMIWFQGTSTLDVCAMKGSRWNRSFTDPPPFTRMSKLRIERKTLKYNIGSRSTINL